MCGILVASCGDVSFMAVVHVRKSKKYVVLLFLRILTERQLRVFRSVAFAMCAILGHRHVGLHPSTWPSSWKTLSEHMLSVPGLMAVRSRQIRPE